MTISSEEVLLAANRSQKAEVECDSVGEAIGFVSKLRMFIQYRNLQNYKISRRGVMVLVEYSGAPLPEPQPSLLDLKLEEGMMTSEPIFVGLERSQEEQLNERR